MTAIDNSHDSALRCWVEGADGHGDWPVQNLPLGIFSTEGAGARPGTAIGDEVLDLAAIANLLPDAVASALAQPTLNALFALPAADRLALRHRLSALLTDEAQRREVERALIPAARVTMHLPAAIGDYTDFYVGIHHATNVGALFRPENPLLPNYKWVPIGYHGRASSVRPSGVPVTRPSGQRKAPDADAPVFGPTQRLDYELELGIWIGPGNALGQPIPISEAGDHAVGFSLLNDWSARDVQAWEYQPLGPFLAKNFHTSVSPWVVTAEALAPFRVAQPPRPAGDPAPLPYLSNDADQDAGALAIELEVLLITADMRQQGLPPHRLSLGQANAMYWTVAQMIAHHTSNGCDLRPGDLLGSGTLSMAEPDGFGSLIELTQGGKAPITLPGGTPRTFLQDHDEVIFRGIARADGHVPIGFGECRAIVLPSP
jgi:fumarylacetoacetase